MTLFGLLYESRQSLNEPPRGSVPGTSSFTRQAFSGKAPLVVYKPDWTQLINGTSPTFLPHALEKPELHVSSLEAGGPTQLPGTKELSCEIAGSRHWLDANVTYLYWRC